MPKTAFQQHFFALTTVVITVAAFVFYSLFVVNASDLMQAAQTSTVWQAIARDGVWMFGGSRSLWLMGAVEIVLAFVLETFIAGPAATKYAFHHANPEKNPEIVFQTVLSCATVAMMCPMMSFAAALMYFPVGVPFDLYHVIMEFARLICFNFPFAFFGQLFFIQPLVRRIFALVFCRHESEQREEEDLIHAETASGYAE